MKHIITGLIIIVSFQLFSQEVATVRIKKKNTLKGLTVKEKYYALKSDTSIRHGEYKRFNVLNDLVESGNYDLGVKDGIWRTYEGGKMVSSEGQYKDGKKEGLWNYYTNIPGSWDPTLSKSGSYSNNNLVGIWTYYFKSGEVEQKYNHSNDSVVYLSENIERSEFLVKTDTGEELIQLERPPLLIGGSTVRSENWMQMDHSELHRLSNGQSDVSYVLSFWLRPNGGETYDYEMVKGVNTDYDNYIIDFYKNNYRWVAGMLNGKEVECKIVISDGYFVKM